MIFTAHLIISYLILVVCLLVLVLLCYYFLTGLVTMFRTKGVPYIPTYDSDLKYFKNLPIEEGKTMVDLGCGDGKMLRFFVKNYKFAQAEGFELNSFAVNYGKLLNKIQKIDNVNLFVKNFKEADLSRYDYIFLYLLPDTMKEFEARIFDTIGHDTIIISNTFSFAEHQPYFSIKNKRGNNRVLFYKK